jgi:hypothetical protein
VRAADARIRAARTIEVDRSAALVIGELEGAGVRCVLLKGRAIAELLYGPGEHRSYVDVDVLVAPSDGDAATGVLRTLGFVPLVEEQAVRGHRPLHACEWTHGAGASVDLHRTLPGSSADPEEVFATLSAETATLRLVGRDVRALAPPATICHVVLHVAHHGPGATKALGDLERAIERASFETWGSAARLAERIGAAPAFAAGLRVTARGAALADRLGLERALPVDVALKAAGAPPLAVGLEWLLRTPGVRGKAALAWRTAFPRPSALRLWRPLARRGAAGLVAAYASHQLWLARHAIPSALAVRRARRRAT